MLNYHNKAICMVVVETQLQLAKGKPQKRPLAFRFTILFVKLKTTLLCQDKMY